MHERVNLLAISQKGEFKTGVIRKQSTPNFPKNERFLHPNTQLRMCVSGVKKCPFFEKFDMHCFLVTVVLRFPLLPYYRRTHQKFKITKLYQKLAVSKCLDQKCNVANVLANA